MTTIEKRAIAIEKNVPVPATSYQSGAPIKYPFADMEIGDSFVVGAEKIDGHRVRVAASHFGKRNARRFMVRQVDNGHRVWRVE